LFCLHDQRLDLQSETIALWQRALDGQDFSATTPRLEREGVLKTVPPSMGTVTIDLSITGVHCPANSGFFSVGLQAESSESVP
jgi:hypothetical protein